MKDGAGAAWAKLDLILDGSPYIRFSLECHRDFDDAKRKKWHAVIFKESGRLVANAYGLTRDEAVTAVVDKHKSVER